MDGKEGLVVPSMQGRMPLETVPTMGKLASEMEEGRISRETAESAMMGTEGRSEESAGREMEEKAAMETEREGGARIGESGASTEMKTEGRSCERAAMATEQLRGKSGGSECGRLCAKWCFACSQQRPPRPIRDASSARCLVVYPKP